MNTFGLKKLPNGKGGFGTCYILNDDVLYKKFHRQNNGKYPFVEEDFERTVGLENDSFVFPKELDTEKGFVKGYTMDYIHAPGFEQIDFDFSISDFILALNKLKEGLYEVTEEGILICDVNAKNMLYDGENIHVIDTDLYIPKEKADIDPYEANEDYLTTYLYYYFTQEKRPYEIGKLINENDELRMIHSNIVKDASISNLKVFLYELRDSVSKLVHKDIDNFSEMYEELGQIR